MSSAAAAYRHRRLLPSEFCRPQSNVTALPYSLVTGKPSAETSLLCKMRSWEKGKPNHPSTGMLGKLTTSLTTGR